MPSEMNVSETCQVLNLAAVLQNPPLTPEQQKQKKATAAESFTTNEH